MSIETFTVLNAESGDESADGHRSGLTLEQAARALLEGAGCIHEIRREGGFATLWTGATDGALAPTDIVSASDEPAAVRREIYRRVVRGELPLPGPLVALSDRDYHRNLVKAAHGVDDAEAALLVKLQNGYYHTLLDPGERRTAEGLVERGVLDRLRQRRKGFEPLYRLAQSAEC
ncbi:MAG: hypothetical protein RLO06_18640 [Parvibaculum sp.]